MKNIDLIIQTERYGNISWAFKCEIIGHGNPLPEEKLFKLEIND